MKTRESGRPLLFTFAVVTALVGGVYGWWRWTHPYGDRTCCMPCMMSALQVYAGEHQGAFPDGTNSFSALQKLYPDLIPARNLAGVSGDIDAASQVIAKGGVLTSNESSWVYFPGLKRDDGPDVMILYERTPGISGIGTRVPGRHAVGFSGGNIRYIPDAEWESFLAEQAKLRAKLFSPR